MVESDVKHIKREECYEITITVTPEEYERIKTSALWERGGGVASYVKWRALGGQSRGC